MKSEINNMKAFVLLLLLGDSAGLCIRLSGTASSPTHRHLNMHQ